MYYCGPHISTHVFPLDGKLVFYLKMIYFLENVVCEKPNQGSEVRLLIEKVQ